MGTVGLGRYAPPQEFVTLLLETPDNEARESRGTNEGAENVGPSRALTRAEARTAQSRHGTGAPPVSIGYREGMRRSGFIHPVFRHKGCREYAIWVNPALDRCILSLN